MRLTDFIADLLDIQNYQKLLINKSRVYQIKQLNKNENKKTSSQEADIFSEYSISDFDAQMEQRKSR